MLGNKDLSLNMFEIKASKAKENKDRNLRI